MPEPAASAATLRPVTPQGRPTPPAPWTLGPGPLTALIASGALTAILVAVREAPPPVQLNVPLLAHISGLLAGYGVALMLVLMSRAPALERGVGADRLARWHALGGRANFALIGIHAISATVAWAQVTGTGIGVAALHLLRLPGLVPATVGTLLLFTIGVASIRAARRRLSYEHWHLLHLTAYLGAGLAFSHQLAGPDLAGVRVGQVAWSLLYTYAYFLVLRYRFVAPVHQALRHHLVVQQVIPEADGVVSIVIGGRHLEELGAESGQFFRWRFLTARMWTSAHPFSLSAPPESDCLRMTVKALGDGSRRVQSVRVGTWVLAEGPYGSMTTQCRRRRAVLLIAGGIGITPMRALFETIDVPGERLTLIYRASSAADVVFRNELDDIAQRRGAKVMYLVGPSSDPANALTSGTLQRMVPHLRVHDVYMCASPGLSRAVKTALLGAGLPSRQLHEEEFSF